MKRKISMQNKKIRSEAAIQRKEEETKIRQHTKLTPAQAPKKKKKRMSSTMQVLQY